MRTGMNKKGINVKHKNLFRIRILFLSVYTIEMSGCVKFELKTPLRLLLNATYRERQIQKQNPGKKIWNKFEIGFVEMILLLADSAWCTDWVRCCLCLQWTAADSVGSPLFSTIVAYHGRRFNSISLNISKWKRKNRRVFNPISQTCGSQSVILTPSRSMREINHSYTFLTQLNTWNTIRMSFSTYNFSVCSVFRFARKSMCIFRFRRALIVQLQSATSAPPH